MPSDEHSTTAAREQDALRWLVYVAEGDREGLTINAKSAERAAEVRRVIERLQSVVTAWQDVFLGIKAHIQDRMAMSDPASPQTYLEIIAADVAEIDRQSASIVNARWADSARHQEEINELESQVCILTAEKITLRDVLRALANAADDVGVKFFDTDTMDPLVTAMQQATQQARAVLPKAGA